MGSVKLHLTGRVCCAGMVVSVKLYLRGRVCCAGMVLVLNCILEEEFVVLVWWLVLNCILEKQFVVLVRSLNAIAQERQADFYLSTHKISYSLFSYG